MTLINNLSPDLIGIKSPELLPSIKRKLPTDVPNGIAWLDASDDTTITESANDIDGWDDKIGQSNDLAQAAEAKMPTYILAELNGKNIVRFNGTTHSMTFPGVIIPGTAARTFIFVLRANSTDANEAIISLTSSAGNFKRYDITGDASGRVTIRIRARSITFNESIVDATNFSILTIQNAANSDINATKGWLNGVPMTVFSSSSGIIDTGTDGTSGIGESLTNPAFFNGDIAEAIAFNAVISTLNRKGLELEVSTKYNIPLLG